MTWDDFNKEELNIRTGLVKTDISCPDCGRSIYWDSTIVLTSYPVKYSYVCPKCGWAGTSYKRYREIYK